MLTVFGPNEKQKYANICAKEAFHNHMNCRKECMVFSSQIMMNKKLVVKKCAFYYLLESSIVYTDILQFKVVSVNLLLWECEAI